MARLRYNNALGTLGAALGASSSGTSQTVTFAVAPSFATIVAPDFIPLVIDPPTSTPNAAFEIAYLTAYTAGQTTGTILRGQEGTSASAHANGASWACAPVVRDFGTTVWRGSGAPSSGLGALTDLYVDDTGGTVYEKQSVATAPSYRSNATAQTGSQPTITINKPAGVVSGDTLIAAIFGDGSAAINALTGWTRLTPLQPVTNFGSSITVLTRVADGTEGSSFTFTGASNNSWTGIVIAYANGAGVDVTASTTVSAAASMNAASVTTTIGHDRVVTIIGGRGSSSSPIFDAPSGYTERVEYVSTTTFESLSISDTDFAPAGATGTIAIPATGGATPPCVTVGIFTVAVKGLGAVDTWVPIGSIAAVAQARFSQVLAITTDATGAATPAAIAASGAQKTVSAMRLQSNANCRARFYARAADRTADFARFASSDPSNTAGVLLEVIFTTAVRDVLIDPSVDLWSLDDPTHPFIVALDGAAASSTVNITLTAIGME